MVIKKKVEIELYKADSYDQFVVWFAYPMNMREDEFGCTTQTEFAKKYELNKDTLTRWKKRGDFATRVKDLRIDWGKEHTGSVFAGWRNACVKGDSRAIELWLSYFEGWDKTQVIKQVQEFTKDDILTLIKVLPEDKQKQFYDIINKLILEAKHASTVLDGGSVIEVGKEDECRVEGDTQTQANNIFQTASGDNEMAKGISKDVLSCMAGETYEANNQGTPWGR